MKTLSNGLRIEEIQRNGLQEIVCAGNPDRVLTQAEWNEAANEIAAENQRRLEGEKKARHAASIEAFHNSRQAVR